MNLLDALPAWCRPEEREKRAARRSAQRLAYRLARHARARWAARQTGARR